MAVCHVGGARAAAGVWRRPGVTGDEPGALAGASAGGVSDSRTGELSLLMNVVPLLCFPPEIHWTRGCYTEIKTEVLLCEIFCGLRRFLVGNKSFWSRFDKRLRFFFLVQINLFQDFSTTKCHFSWFHVLCQNTKIEFWFCCYSGAFDHISWSSSADSSFVCEHLKNFLSSLVLKLS